MSGDGSRCAWRAPYNVFASQALQQTLSALSELRRISARNLVELFSRKLLWRHPGGIAGLAEEAVQTGRRRDPEQKQFLFGVLKAVPRVLRYEDGGALFEGAAKIVLDEYSSAFQNIEGLIHFEVPMDRNATAAHDLLGSKRQMACAGCGTDLDEDVAVIAEVNEMFALAGVEQRSLWGRGLGC
jgi:hypothetical protein